MGIRELALLLGPLPPLVGAATAALTLLLARRIGATWPVALLAGLMTALSGDALAVFHHGQLDHRMIVPFAVIVAALGWQARSLPAWIAGHALLFLMTPDATAIATVLVLIAGASECICLGSAIRSLSASG